MGIFARKSKPSSATSTPQETLADFEKQDVDNSPVRLFTPRIFAMAMIISIGGLIFGYGVALNSS